MKSRHLLFALLLAGFFGMQEAAWAQARWRDLSREERREMRQQMREHWHQERDMRGEEGGRRWGEMPPEDRRRMREEMREQRGWQQPAGEWRERANDRIGRGWRRE